MNTYRIGELARATNLSIDTIRYYEQIGLIPEPQREQNQYRVYSKEYIAILEFILTCKNNGFTLKEINHMIQLLKYPKRNKEKLQKEVHQKIVYIDEKIEELIRLKDQLKESLDACNLSECALLDVLKSSK